MIYDILLPEVLQSWCTIIIYVGEIEKPGRGFRSLMMEKKKEKIFRSVLWWQLAAGL